MQRNFIAHNYSKLQYLYCVARTARNKDTDVIKKEKQKNGENNKRLTIKTKKRGGAIQTIERGGESHGDSATNALVTYW